MTSKYRPPDLMEAKEKMIAAFTAPNPADFLCIYSRNQRVQMDMIVLCQKEGWMDEGEFVELDSQSSEHRYRLTDSGRVLCGLNSKVRDDG